MKLAGRDVRRRCVALFVCLFTAASSVHGTVLCFGADGHIEFESVFHEQCADHDHSWSLYHWHDFSDAEHEGNRHCHYGRCVDVSVDVALARISRIQMTEQLDRTVDAVCADLIVAVGQVGYSVHFSASNTLFDTSYFDPLRTIILLA